jgi:endoglucanase
MPERRHRRLSVLAPALGLVAFAAPGAVVYAAPPGEPAGHAAARARDPFAGARLYVDPDSRAQRQVEAWRESRPADAAALAKVARQPQADWFVETGDVRVAVADRVRTISAAGRLPVLVAYNIPLRDCHGHSAGGARSAKTYRRWASAFAAGLGRQRAVVILEPDALAHLDCLSPRRRRLRLALVAYALRVLTAKPRVAVYVDAGHSGWQPAETMASRLERVGISRARGFSLNVANFRRDSTEIAYGGAISAQIGGKPFVIDTGRNGAGPPSGGEFCNPPGRALGRRPTSRTGRRLVDAYLWIKPPGESDGECNGGPPAGAWWPEFALGLAQRAAW